MENTEKCKSHMRSGEYMCLIEIPGEMRNENGADEIFEDISSPCFPNIMNNAMYN